MATEEQGEKSESVATVVSAPSGGMSKAVLGLTVLNFLVTAGMAVLVFVSFQKEKKSASVGDIQTQAAQHEEKKEGEAGKEGEGGENAAGHSTATKKKSAEFGKIVTLDQFTVNLSTPGSVNPKFVRVNVSLEVETEDLENEVNSRMPQVRNVVIDLFNSKRPGDLATVENRDYLKDEIKNALNGFLVSGKVKGVYFTNFTLGG